MYGDKNFISYLLIYFNFIVIINVLQKNNNFIIYMNTFY